MSNLDWRKLVREYQIELPELCDEKDHIQNRCTECSWQSSFSSQVWPGNEREINGTNVIDSIQIALELGTLPPPELLWTLVRLYNEYLYANDKNQHLESYLAPDSRENFGKNHERYLYLYQLEHSWLDTEINRLSQIEKVVWASQNDVVYFDGDEKQYKSENPIFGMFDEDGNEEIENFLRNYRRWKKRRKEFYENNTFHKEVRD